MLRLAAARSASFLARPVAARALGAALPGNLTLADTGVLEEPPAAAPTVDVDFRAPLTAAVVSLADGAPTGATVELPRDVFGVEFRPDVVQRVVRWQLAKRRAGTQFVKRRGEVRGGGKKPWAQKGTGRARAGSIRAPQFRGGGKAHGARTRSFEYKLPRKVRALGLRSALSQRRREGALTVVDSAALGSHKTRAMTAAMDAHGWDSVFIVDGEAVDAQLLLAQKNLKAVRALPARGANVYDVVRRKQLVLTLEGLEALVERLSV